MIIYADADFILAILKEDDWLKENAEKVLRENRGELKTSIVAVAESFLVLNRDENVDDFIRLAEDITEIFDLMYVDEEKVLQAAIYMEEKHSTPFDAFHAALSEGMPIISSDGFYEEIDTENENLRDE